MFPNTLNALMGYVNKFIAFIAYLLRKLGMNEMASQLEDYTI